MRRGYLFLLIAFCFSVALAVPQTTRVNPVMLGHAGNGVYELDRSRPDTIRYDNNSAHYLTTGITNFWCGTRFTPNADFKLQSAYFWLTNQTGTPVNPCSLFVYHDTLISGVHHPVNPISTMWGRVATPSYYPTDNDITFTDSTIFSGGTDFWLIYGPIPGGAYTANNGFWNIMDNGSNSDGRCELFNGARSLISTLTPGAAGYRLLCRAGGTYQAGVVDGRVDSLYASNAAGDRKFFWNYNTPVRYSAIVENLSTNAISGYQVDFAVIDTSVSATDTVFHQRISTGLPSLAHLATTTVTSAYDTMPNTNKNYTVKATLILSNDADLSNNTVLLEQKVNNLNCWYTYTLQGTSTVGFSAGDVGCGFIPTHYPAVVDTVTIALQNSATTAATDTMFLVLIDSVGTQTIPFFKSFSVAPTTGGNFNIIKIAIDSTVIIQQGGQVLVMWQEVSQTQALITESTPPTAGTNLSMPGATWEWDGQQFSPAATGDWLFTAHLVPYISANPVLRTNPVPNTNIFFDSTAVGNSNTKSIWVYNDGGSSLHVTRIYVNNALYRSALAINDTSFFVASGDSHHVNITWTPAITDSMNVPLILQSNAPTSQVSWRLIGLTRSTSVAEEASGLPKVFALYPNYPNPFNPVTQVRFALPVASNVRLTVFDVNGRQVATLANGHVAAGYHTAVFDGAKFASGAYFYRIEAGSFSDIHKMMLLK